MTNKPFATGQCLCGAVRYTVTSEPSYMVQCHCKDCQRASGTGHMSTALFKKDTITVEGLVTGYGSTTDRGNILTRYFCPTCGGRIFSENSDRPEQRGIAVGSIDENSWFSPQVVVYTKYRHNWDINKHDVPDFESMPPE